jgi:hypothetical protein
MTETPTPKKPTNAAKSQRQTRSRPPNVQTTLRPGSGKTARQNVQNPLRAGFGLRK